MELGAADFQLIALLPGNLQRIFGDRGAEYFGIVNAADGGWCWSFHADGVDQRSEVFPSKEDAEVDLRWIHFSLYPTRSRFEVDPLGSIQASAQAIFAT